MDIALSDTLRRCFDARHEANYDVFASFDENEVEKLLSEAEHLLKEIRLFLS